MMPLLSGEGVSGPRVLLPVPEQDDGPQAGKHQSQGGWQGDLGSLGGGGAAMLSLRELHQDGGSGVSAKWCK
jgi:hypothetical protein